MSSEGFFSASDGNCPSTSQQQLQTFNNVRTANDDERTCWICFGTDEDNRLAVWVKPCKCRGTMQWVHERCLCRWIDEKQRGSSNSKAVLCPQCQTKYIIFSPSMGIVANILEKCDVFIKRMSPFLAAGVFIGTLYWSAVTFGAVTYIQVFGHEKALAMLEDSDAITLLIGLPAIPVGLVLGRMIQWESAVIKCIRNRHNIMRSLPLVKFIVSRPDDEEELPQVQSSASPPYIQPVLCTRVFCGALLLPTISILIGRLLFSSVESRLPRILLGGLTFITVKGLLKIYLIERQLVRRKQRRIVDYNEENLQAYRIRNDNTSSRSLLLRSSSLLLQSYL